jgi:prepilin-type processing-associated H-X9-DG protein
MRARATSGNGSSSDLILLGDCNVVQDNYMRTADGYYTPVSLDGTGAYTTRSRFSMNTNATATDLADPTKGGRPGLRHAKNKQANMVFLDGHAAPLTLKELQLKPGDLTNPFDVARNVFYTPRHWWWWTDNNG